MNWMILPQIYLFRLIYVLTCTFIFLICGPKLNYYLTTYCSKMQDEGLYDNDDDRLEGLCRILAEKLEDVEG